MKFVSAGEWQTKDTVQDDNRFLSVYDVLEAQRSESSKFWAGRVPPLADYVNERASSQRRRVAQAWEDRWEMTLRRMWTTIYRFEESQQPKKRNGKRYR